MKLHYSQTEFCTIFTTFCVSVPYEITLLSNPYETADGLTRFQYLMKLHYSQTNVLLMKLGLLFQYLMKLHYSQTSNYKCKFLFPFQYLMKLHYSQTSNKLRHYNAQGNNIRYIYYTIYVSPSSITQRSLSTTYSFSPSHSLCGSEFSSIKKLICSRAKAFNSSDISSGEK